MADESSKTARKQRKVPGKPFVKGDPRINRKGRPPNNSAELNALIDEIFAEQLSDGKTSMAKIRVALNRLLLHKNPAGPIHVLDRRYGKVSERLDLSNSDGTLKPEMPVAQIAQRVIQLQEIAKQRKAKNGN